MPCLTRTPSRGPFVLARTVVLVSALALLGYLPLANPLTAPSLGVRAYGLNCRARASPGIVGLKPQQADLLRKFFRLPLSNPGRLKLYSMHIVLQ